MNLHGEVTAHCRSSVDENDVPFADLIVSTDRPNTGNRDTYYTHGSTHTQLRECTPRRVIRNMYPYNLKYPVMFLPVVNGFALMTRSLQLKKMATSLGVFLCDEDDTEHNWINDMVSNTLLCNGMEDLHAEEILTKIPYCVESGSPNKYEYISNSKFGLLCDYAVSFIARNLDLFCSWFQSLPATNPTAYKSTPRYVFDYCQSPPRARTEYEQWTIYKMLMQNFTYKAYNGYDFDEILIGCDIDSYFSADGTRRLISQTKEGKMKAFVSKMSSILRSDTLRIGLSDTKCRSKIRCVAYPNPLNNLKKGSDSLPEPIFPAAQPPAYVPSQSTESLVTDRASDYLEAYILSRRTANINNVGDDNNDLINAFRVSVIMMLDYYNAKAGKPGNIGDLGDIYYGSSYTGTKKGAQRLHDSGEWARGQMLDKGVFSILPSPLTLVTQVDNGYFLKDEGCFRASRAPKHLKYNNNVLNSVDQTFNVVREDDTFSESGVMTFTEE